MFQGSAHVKSGDHLGLIQAAGGSVNGTTSYDRTNYFEAVPKPALRLALWLEADRLGTLLETVDQASLDNQRDVVKEEKRQRYDNVPYGDVWHRLLALSFPADHPYAHPTIGSMQHLDAATLTDIQAFFRTHYRASRAVLTLAGDITADEGFRLAEQYFGHLPRHPGRQRPQLAPLPPHAGIPREDVRAAVPRDSVYATWLLPSAPHPDLEALGLATSILGDGITSRLHQALVRTELAEGAGAFTMSLARGNSVAVASARCWEGVDPEDARGRARRGVAAVRRRGTDARGARSGPGPVRTRVAHRARRGRPARRPAGAGDHPVRHSRLGERPPPHGHGRHAPRTSSASRGAGSRPRTAPSSPTAPKRPHDDPPPTDRPSAKLVVPRRHRAPPAQRPAGVGLRPSRSVRDQRRPRTRPPPDLRAAGQ